MILDPVDLLLEGAGDEDLAKRVGQSVEGILVDWLSETFLPQSQGTLLFLDYFLHFDALLVVLEIGVRKEGENGALAEVGLQNADSLGVEQLGKQILLHFLDFVQMVSFEDVFDFEGTLSLELEARHQIESVFRGDQEVDDARKNDQEGEEVFGKDLLEGDWFADVLPLDVFHAHEVREVYILQPFGAEIALVTPNLDLFENVHVELRFWVSLYWNQQKKYWVQKVADLLGDAEETQELAQQSAPLVDLSPNLFQAVLVESQRALLRQQDLYLLTDRGREFDCLPSLIEGLFMIPELRVARGQLEIALREH